MRAVINIKAFKAAPWEMLSSKPETNAVDQRLDSTFLISYFLSSRPLDGWSDDRHLAQFRHTTTLGVFKATKHGRRSGNKGKL